MDEKKKASAARIRANNKWNKKTYFQFLTRFPKQDEQKIREAAGDSLNGFIVSAVMEKIERDSNKG